MATACATFRFDEQTHSYFNGRGERVPSVTQILNAVGLVNYDGIPSAVLDHKAEIGKAAHSAAWFHDEGDLDWETLDPEVEPYVRGWEKFRNETNFSPELIEYRGIATVNCYEYGFTLDRIGKFNGHQTLLEIKCTANVEMSWGAQTAAYCMAMRDRYPTLFRMAVHLRPNGTYSLVPLAGVNDYLIFQAALAIESYKLGKERHSNGNGSTSQRG